MSRNIIYVQAAFPGAAKRALLVYLLGLGDAQAFPLGQAGSINRLVSQSPSVHPWPWPIVQHRHWQIPRIQVQTLTQ